MCKWIKINERPRKTGMWIRWLSNGYESQVVTVREVLPDKSLVDIPFPNGFHPSSMPFQYFGPIPERK
jgi:hypothetical protein